MNFKNKKLTLGALKDLKVCPMESVSPYALFFYPVYVYLKANQKFISVKGPLDYFNPKELEKLRPLKNFFIPTVCQKIEPFQLKARTIRRLLSLDVTSIELPKNPEESEKFPKRLLPISPYEMSDAVLKSIASLWGNQVEIEPFFISVFANEVCDSLPASLLDKAREKSVDQFEKAFLRASVGVFLALHLGYCQLDFINNLRNTIFQNIIEGKSDDHFESVEKEVRGHKEEVIALVNALFKADAYPKLTKHLFECHSGTISQKIVDRLSRIQQEFSSNSEASVKTYGPEGVLDV